MKVEKTTLNLRLGTSTPLGVNQVTQTLHFLSIGLIPNTKPKARVVCSSSPTMLKGRGVAELHIGEDTLRRETNTIIEKYSGYVECWEDVSNMPLDVKLMRPARNSEMEFFRNMGVWPETLPKATVKARCGRVIQGRWVDTNKGDSTAPDYRARFVGEEFKTGIDPTLYAATPPLEALKLIMSQANGSRSNGILTMLSDVKRAYFNALARRELYVELPREDLGYIEGRCIVGRLR